MERDRDGKGERTLCLEEYMYAFARYIIYLNSKSCLFYPLSSVCVFTWWSKTKTKKNIFFSMYFNCKWNYKAIAKKNRESFFVSICLSLIGFAFKKEASNFCFWVFARVKYLPANSHLFPYAFFFLKTKKKCLAF